MRLAVNLFETDLKKQVKLGNSKLRLPEKAETPMQTSYRPEKDVSRELEPIEAA